MLNEDYSKLTLFNEDLYGITHNYVVDNVEVSFFFGAMNTNHWLRFQWNCFISTCCMIYSLRDSFSLSNNRHVDKFGKIFHKKSNHKLNVSMCSDFKIQKWIKQQQNHVVVTTSLEWDTQLAMISWVITWASFFIDMKSTNQS